MKYEEVYRTEYRDLAEPRPGIRVFLEKVYNQKGLHVMVGKSLCLIKSRGSDVREMLP